ncbi:MAG: mechanosensitive ion channel, partial [Alphaproteobacteria bacterium]|nr:mechanosensitive ion channel [Alphaproteobacteria bacterium]
MRVRFGGALKLLTAALVLFWLAGPLATPRVAAAEAPTAKSSEAAKSPGALTARELGALVETLEDEAKRKEFLRTLKAILEARRAAGAAAKPESGSSFLSGLSERAKKAAAEIVDAAGVLLKAGAMWTWIGTQWDDPIKRDRWWEGLWKTLVILGLGLLTEMLARLALRRPRRAVEAKDSDAWPIRLLFLGARTFLDLLPIAGFAVAAYGALPLLAPSEPVRLIALTIIYANLFARAVSAIARMILVPKAESLRLIPLDTSSARYLFLWVRRLANIGIYGYFIIEAALLFGLPAGGHAVLLKLLGLSLAIMVVVFLLQNREAVGTWLRAKDGAGDEDKSFNNIRAHFADVWHILAVLYVTAMFIVWALDIAGGFEFLIRASLLTAVILSLASILTRILDRGITRLFRVGADMQKGAAGLEERANRYLPVLHKAIRAIVYSFALLAVLQTWGVDTIGWITGPTGEAIVSSAIAIVVVIVAALVFWELVSSAIERYLEHLTTETKDRDRAKRLGTLLPLARKAIFIALVVFVALIVLSELGVNIGPLLAGAGVVGLAIGFGAQTLVKDIITGLFILIEDTLKVGDVVEVAGASGTVEAVSVRTMTLRDLWGNLHVIPFSEISSVKNSSPDYAYYLFDIGVGYGEDVDRVMAVLREIDEDVRADKEFGPAILEPL